MQTTPLNRPELFINRELSLLEFNRRVLCQAQDPRVPLLERLRFLVICSTNLDEFFEIRVSSLRHQRAFDVTKPRADGGSPTFLLREISRIAHDLVDEQYRTLSDDILPQLSKEGIQVLTPEDWTPEQLNWAQKYFHNEILPVLTPIGLDPAHPFPLVLNKGLNLIVAMTGSDDFGRDSGVAVLQIPRCLPRLLTLPTKESNNQYQFVMLRTIIQHFIDDIFPGMQVTGCTQFRVTRNSDLWVEEEEVDDLLKALEGELPNRRYSEAVRLEVSDNCSEELAHFLLNQFELTEEDLYRVNGPVNLPRFGTICDLVERASLKYPPFIPWLPNGPANVSNLFEYLKTNDILLHHPFQTFFPVVELVRQAAIDPKVLAIKQTLYRTGDKSPMVAALIEAAKAGKEVTAVIELRARFDEAANIDLATKLQSEGANVVYGIVGYKTHAKMLLVVRREESGLRRYVHLGTGNYHTRTARFYSDWGLMTSDKHLGQDVHHMFMALTGLGHVPSLEKILPSPVRFAKTFKQLIEKEIEFKKQGKDAHIIAKCNSLSDDGIVQGLYQASQAGVKVDLIIRGICSLRPGIPGISDNIRVRSIIGRFLEHTRVYYFHHGGEQLIYCASADLMRRNLHRRVEACFPIDRPALKKRVLEEGLLSYLKDNSQAWELDAQGRYHRLSPAEGEADYTAQLELLRTLTTFDG